MQSCIYRNLMGDFTDGLIYWILDFKRLTSAVCLITIQSGLKVQVQGLLLFCKAQYTKVYEHLQKVA